MSRGGTAKTLGGALLLLVSGATLLSCVSCSITTRMPGDSFQGDVPAATAAHRAQVARLERHVRVLSDEIGERNTARPAELRRAADYIAEQLQALGLTVQRHGYMADAERVENLEVTIAGHGPLASQLVVVGAHYDTAHGTPGANDNGSGVAMLLELARAFAGHAPARTLRLVAFTNEEPPYFRTELMGSRVYAHALRQAGADVVAMLSLETVGYYSDEDGSQHYPFPFSAFYPSRGDFVAFVANRESRALAQNVVELFRQHAQLPSEGVAAPEFIPGIDWSDQQGFWLQGYPGLMVTDTAPNRYQHYHEPSDTPDRLDYGAMARVTQGLQHVVQRLLHDTARPDVRGRTRLWRM